MVKISSKKKRTESASHSYLYFIISFILILAISHFWFAGTGRQSSGNSLNTVTVISETNEQSFVLSVEPKAKVPSKAEEDIVDEDKNPEIISSEEDENQGSGEGNYQPAQSTKKTELDTPAIIGSMVEVIEETVIQDQGSQENFPQTELSAAAIIGSMVEVIEETVIQDQGSQEIFLQTELSAPAISDSDSNSDSDSEEDVVNQESNGAYPPDESANVIIESDAITSDEVSRVSGSSISGAAAMAKIFEEIEFSREECSFFRAIKSKNMKKLKKLIAAKRDRQAKCNGRNALRYAVETLNVKATRMLIESQAYDVEEPLGKSTNTLLHFAVLNLQDNYKKALIIAELFINDVADINLRDELGYCPIFYAVKNLSIKLLNTLLYNGAEISKKLYTNDNIFHHIMNIDNNHKFKSNFGPIFKKLIREAELHRKTILLKEFNDNNHAPIHEAAAKNCIEGLKELISYDSSSANAKSLLRGKINPPGPTLYGATPLHFAAYNGSIDAVKYLLSVDGISIEQDEDGKFPSEYSTDESIIAAFEKMK